MGPPEPGSQSSPALHSGFRGGDALRFLTTAGPAVSDIRTRSELDAVDEQLALIDTTQSASLVRSLEELNRMSRGGTLVVVTGLLNESIEPVVARAKRTFGLVLVVSCVRTPDGSWPWAMTYDANTDLSSEWNLAVTSAKGAMER